MNRIKYGKIRRSSHITNIFSTTVQLVIRMKQLIEGQFEYFKKYPDSELIPSIIDAYQQLENKEEYIDINPFIQAMKKEFQSDNHDIKFVEFFSSVICSIDFSNVEDIRYSKDPICFTSLIDKINKKKDEMLIFDISFKSFKKLSDLIQNQYEFSKNIYKKPSFLFFSPVKNETQLTNFIIDEKITLGNENYKYLKTNYFISIIVAKKIQDEYINHFILYVGTKDWIKIEDENIVTIDKKDAFQELVNSKEYNIELLGYCQNPDENIVLIDFYEPKKIENYDLSEFKQTASKQSSIDKPIQNKLNETATKIRNKNIIYTVKLIKFDYRTLTYDDSLEEKEFDSVNKRDQYLNEIENYPSNKYTQLFFDNGKTCDRFNIFDDDDINITVYSTRKSEASLFEKPIEIFFQEYFNDDDIIDEEPDEYVGLFYPGKTISELFDFCYKALPGKPTKLYLKDENYDTLLTKSSNKKITSIVKKNKPTIVYYARNPDNYISSQSKPIPDSKASSQNQSDTQKTNTSFSQPKPKLDSNASLSSLPNSQTKTSDYNQYYNLFNKEKNKSIVIMKYLRNCIYSEKYSSALSKFICTDRSKLKGTLNDLLEKLFPNSDLQIISYYIESKNDFIVKYLDPNQPIHSLPPYFNVQGRPHKGLPYRICTLLKSASFSSISDINKDCISFAILLDLRKGTLDSIYEPIINYLYNGTNEKKYKQIENYIPKIYFFLNNQFIEINSYKTVQKNEFLPIFVIWNSPSVYDVVEGLFKKYTQNKEL